MNKQFYQISIYQHIFLNSNKEMSFFGLKNMINFVLKYTTCLQLKVKNFCRDESIIQSFHEMCYTPCF